jgi:DNA-binding response OmpR family regulator
VDEQRLILVVEDEDATREFLVENLAADGFRAVGATSAGEGLRAIDVRRPALVLLDLALESSTGLDLLNRVRHADGLASRIDPDLPVTVLTGRVGEADRVRSFARGADDYVPKPTRSLSPRPRSGRALRLGGPDCPRPAGGLWLWARTRAVDAGGLGALDVAGRRR